ncbi:hypothetical protein [Aquimarina sediminis]|uniref:hypothetical protein n=1 Tax=Aquimarina sediminis TaxID=2070536 RepID=UPI000CA05A74|nr:hypothetical protein [Aquimarina sediminis]
MFFLYKKYYIAQLLLLLLIFSNSNRIYSYHTSNSTLPYSIDRVYVDQGDFEDSFQENIQGNNTYEEVDREEDTRDYFGSITFTSKKANIPLDTSNGVQNYTSNYIKEKIYILYHQLKIGS